MGGAQMGDIFDTDVRNFRYSQLGEQDIIDMQSAAPERLGRFISEAMQAGNQYLGFVALGVLASAAVEPVPYEMKRGLWGRERAIYDQDAVRLLARRKAVLGNYMSQFAKVDFEKASVVTTPDTEPAIDLYGDKV